MNPPIVFQHSRRTLMTQTIALLALGACKPNALAHTENEEKTVERPDITDEEFALLADPAIRKKILGDATLIIKNRTIQGEARRLDEGVVLNNVHFENCNFFNHFMFGVNMKNVNFTNCGIGGVRWEGGIWADLVFRDCIVVGREVSIQSGNGSGTTLYEKCQFEGSEPPKGLSPADYEMRGNISAPGVGKFVNCNFQRMMVYCDKEAEFINCKFNFVSMMPTKLHGVVIRFVLDGCTGDYIDFGQNNYREVILRNSSFIVANMRLAVANHITLENVKGHFELRRVQAHRVTATGCTFMHPEGRDDLKDDAWGLSLAGVNIKTIEISDCKFQGKNPRLYFKGQPTKLDANGKVIPWISKRNGQVLSYPALIDTLTIKNTPIAHGDISYTHAKQLVLEDLSLTDTTFANSEIGKLTLKRVRLAGTLNFTQSKIKEIVSQDVVRDSTLNIIKIKSKVDLQ